MSSRRMDNNDSALLLRIRSALIQRISSGTLKNLLDGLQDKSHPVISRREAEDIMQISKPQQDQVTSLIDMVHKKGDKACGILLSLLEDEDNYLYQDLCLDAAAGIAKKDAALCTSRTETSMPTSSPTEDATSKEVIQQLKKRMEKDLERILQGVELNGEIKDLHDMYTKLHVLKDYKLGAIHDLEALRRQDTNAQAAGKEETIELSDVFRDASRKRLLTMGVAGVGKTISVKKFILDWAKGHHNQHFDFVFPLSFRALNIKAKKNEEKNDKYSLIKLLESEFPEIKALNTPLNHYNVLFIFDGLDECVLPLNFEDDKESDVQKDTALDTLVVSVISGSLLPSASVWITSRPSAASRIHCWPNMQMTEIRGFNEEQKLQYFERNCETNSAAFEQIKKCIKKSRTLNVMCQIPLFCWILLIVTKDVLCTPFAPNQNKNSYEGTMTTIYLRFLRQQMYELQKRFQQNWKSETETDWSSTIKNPKTEVHIQNLLNLGKLAFCKLNEGLPTFYEQDLEKYGITSTNAEFLTVCTQTRDSPDSVTNVYEFVHLSIQEFLAAFFAFYSLRNYKKDVLKKRGILEWLYWLVFSNKMLALQKTAVDQALESTDGHLDLFLRFLLGFTLMSNQKLFQDIVPGLKCKEENVQAIVEYIQQKIETSPPEKTINLFYCLSEMKIDSLVKEIQSFLTSGKLPRQDLSSTQWSALVFVLLTSEDTKNHFDLKKYGKSKALEKLLPVIKNTQKALLDNCLLNESSCKPLAKVISSSSQLTELDLSDNDLQNSGVKELFSEPNPNKPLKWNLQTLRLSRCRLTENSCSILASAICKNNSHLATLDLSHNALQDHGVYLLTPGIYHLGTLLLQKCNLTVESCKLLASSLTSSNLKVLDMSNNCLKYDANDQRNGLKIFFEALMSSQCKLEELRLQKCNLTVQSCRLLASSFKSSTYSNLKVLDMSNNDLKCDSPDTGMEFFFEALRSSHCKLEELRLQKCNLRGICCKGLSKNLISSQLKKLDLSTNDLQNEGITFLCSELESQQSAGCITSPCKLESLVLSQCNLTGKSCAVLVASLLKKTSCLTDLDLSNNDLQTRGAQELSTALLDPACSIKTLRLSGCLIPEVGFSALNSALQTNVNLRELDVRLNIQDIHSGKGTQLITTKLRNPHDVLGGIQILQYPVLELDPSLLTDLGQLSKEDMKSFKNYVLDTVSDDMPGLLEARLEQADVGDTVRLMTQSYGAEKVLNMSQDILKRLKCENQMDDEDQISPVSTDIADSVFFYKVKEELCDKLGNLENILRTLEKLGVLTANEKMSVEIESKGYKQNRTLIDILNQKREWSHRKFYQSLQTFNPVLVDSLKMQIDNNRHRDEYQRRYQIYNPNISLL
ncbi:hypothetical protein ACEWY4_021906 [Coilia grayii]|uniref:NACHT, LRR and PYD domains-containing protein 12-like n=1 Tax=Coilia grayii TaxID=363190 RepID=A0ABD1J4J4_9TELE